MSEKRKPVDLGELTPTAAEALRLFTSWRARFTAMEKAEVLSILQTFVAAELQREQARKAEETQLNYQRLATALEHHGEVQ